MKIIPFLLLLFTLKSVGQDRDSTLQRKIDSIVTMYMSREQIVGISIGIVRNNRIYYAKGYGATKINSDRKVDPLTNFHTASISKLFTATAVMQLDEQDKLNINDKLTDYLPEFKMKDQRYKNITIKQMLNHTSGLPFLSEYNWNHPKNDRHALKNYVLTSDRKSVV